MAAVKVDISWSPTQEDAFVTFGSDLSLYKVEQIPPGSTSPPKIHGMKLSDRTYASLVTVNTEHQYLKCMAWYPKPQPENLVAVGHANGKVVLTCLGKTNSTDHRSGIATEFIPKHQRQSSYLAWSPDQCNLLAHGLEKYRTDYSILIWDINRSSYTDVYSSDRKQHTWASDSSLIVTKPLVELGSAETTLSLAWFCQKSLVTGMNNKFLRIFDLKDTSRPQSAAYTKAVYGVKVDPLQQHRLASFYEGQIAIWDTRNFEKPVCTLMEPKHVVKLSWSPIRSGLLASLTKDNNVIKMYDIRHSTIGEEVEPLPAAERRITSPDNQPLFSFDWHPTHENRLLTISASDIRDIVVYDRIAVAWSPDIHLTLAYGRQVRQCHTIKLSEEVNEDIAIRMKRRAMKGYGLQATTAHNGNLVSEDPALRHMWTWIHEVKELSIGTEVQKHSLKHPQPANQRVALTRPMPGVKAILRDLSPTPPQPQGVGGGVGGGGPGGQVSRSELDFWQWQINDGYKLRAQRKVFRSEERLRAIELCGWAYNKDSHSLPIIDRLERQGDHERAAAIAVFMLKMKRAIQLLNGGARSREDQADSVNLNVVAMALSGFSDEKKTLWRETSSRLCLQLSNPYLRRTFTFLTGDGDNMEEILGDADLKVADRVALACFYLPDAKVHDFIDSVTAELTSAGHLDGLLLTGFTVDVLDLLENYVDRTGDVQTASVTLLQALPNPDLARDPRVNHWIDSYRTLLDTWRLWRQRAEFDVCRQACDNASRPPPQVFVSCNFCGKSVSFNSLASRNRLFMYGGGSMAHKPRVTSCPSCRKPLPRCALCLINMGTSAGGGVSGNRQWEQSDEAKRLSRFSDWFTWCQSCRHGGHAQHISNWFREHSECPVTGCSCRCVALDNTSTQTEDSQTLASPH